MTTGQLAPPAEHRPRRLVRWLIAIGLFAAAATVITCAGVIFWAGTHFGTDTENLTVAEAERYGKFTLPAGAKDFHAHLMGFQDYYLQIRFSMPPDALDSFLASTIVAKPLSTGDNLPYKFDHGPSSPSWWTPGKSTKFLTGTCPDNNKVMQYILIDQSDPDSYVVYLIAHDM